MSEVQPWNGWKLIKAQMTLRAEAPATDVLDAVATGLGGAGFKAKDRSDLGFRAVYTNKLLLLDLTLQRTTLEVSAAPDATSAEITVRVVAGGSHSAGGTHAAEGLSAAVRSLEDRGLRVTVTEWSAPDRD